MKKIFLFILIITQVVFKSFSDEGIWLPMLLDRLNYVAMQKIGLHLSADEL